MPEPDKQTKERPKQMQPQAQQKQQEEQSPKKPMFSAKGLIVLVAALFLEAIACVVLMVNMAHGSNGAEIKKADTAPKVARAERKYVSLTGPLFTVQEAPGDYRVVQVAGIEVEIDASLDKDSQKNLEDNLKDLNNPIKEALQSIIVAEGHAKLVDPVGKQKIQNRLRQQIIQLLGVSEKEIKSVYLDSCQIGRG